MAPASPASPDRVAALLERINALEARVAALEAKDRGTHASRDVTEG
jgi:BMFP domain-containing protein YqiC